MATYSVARDSFALSTAGDSLTIIPAANHPIQIIEISIAGMGTASAANSLGVYRSSSGATPTGAIVCIPQGKIGSGSNPVANTTTATGWTTQPTITASAGYGLMLDLGVNANGGIYRWVARPGEEIICASSDTISFRAVTGSSTVSLHVVFLEDCF